MIVIPDAATSSPTVHGKDLALRFLMAAMLPAAVLAWNLGARVTPWCTARLAMAGFAVSQALACAFSPEPVYCVRQTWPLWMLPAAGALLPAFRPSPAELSGLWRSVMAAAAAVLVYGYMKYFGFDPLAWLYPFKLGAEGRSLMHSFLGNPEYFGGYAAAVAVLALAASLRGGSGAWRRRGWVAATAALLLAVALSGTRGAFLGFAVGGVAVAWAAWRARPAGFRMPWRAVAVAAAVASAGVLTLSTENRLNPRGLRLAQRFAQVGDLNSTSVKERLVFFGLAARVGAERPVLGWGPGMFRLRYHPALDALAATDDGGATALIAQELGGKVADHAHSDYLETWAQSGAVGLGALLLAIAALGVRFVAGVGAAAAAARASPAGACLATMRAGFFGASACLFANALFSFPLQMPERATLAWLLAGAFLAADQKSVSAGSDAAAGPDAVAI